MPENKENTKPETKEPTKPDWLCDLNKRFAIIRAIDEAFEQNCSCNCAKILRQYAKDFKDFFTPTQPFK